MTYLVLYLYFIGKTNFTRYQLHGLVTPSQSGYPQDPSKTPKRSRLILLPACVKVFISMTLVEILMHPLDSLPDSVSIRLIRKISITIKMFSPVPRLKICLTEYNCTFVFTPSSHFHVSLTALVPDCWFETDSWYRHSCNGKSQRVI